MTEVAKEGQYFALLRKEGKEVHCGELVLRM